VGGAPTVYTVESALPVPGAGWPVRDAVGHKPAGQDMGGEVAMPLEGELTIYLASGKKKHSRFFWVDQTEDAGLVQISWGKSLRSKTCKTRALIAVEGTPTMRDPRTMFDEVDDDGRCAY
jgi:hypothetical protein